MHTYKKIFISILLYLNFIPFAFASEKLFYVLRNGSPEQMTAAQNVMNSLNKNYKSIDIIVSQAYQIDDNGIVWGSVNPEVLEFANKHHIKHMLLITNTGFDKQMVHRFLANPEAQQKAIDSIIQACQKIDCYGVQLDFEMVPYKDKDRFTKFYVDATNALHKKGYVVSMALAPTVSDELMPSNFLQRVYLNWEGAYDFKKLGEVADFVSIMSYNQSGVGTTPGPTASIKWVEATIQYALKYIPRDKISLGIPSYSTYWYTGNDEAHKVKLRYAGLSYGKVLNLLNKYHVKLKWDDKAKLHYAMYENNFLNEYIFAEDAQSFAAKQDLVKKYNLRGFSFFDLGTEDPHIWTVIN